jgi:hypothetical protein
MIYIVHTSQYAWLEGFTLTKFKWHQVVLIGLLCAGLFIPVVYNRGTITAQARLTPMVSTHYKWNQTFGGIAYDEGTAIVETADGGFAISGRTASFGEVVGTEEVWLVRCDENGTHLWNHTYGGGMTAGGDMHAFHKSVRLEDLPDGGFLISSHTAKYSAGDADAWLIRTDADGNHLWNYTYSGPDHELLAESVACSDGGYLSGGWTENFTLGNIDGWLIRTDADGNHLWNYTYGSPTFGEVCYDVIEVSTGGFLMTCWAGDFSSTEDPDLFNVDVGCWIVRVDADGNHLWNQTYGTSHPGTYGVECQDGGFAFIGATGNNNERTLDVFLIRTDANGQHLWNQTYGDTDIDAAFEFAECSDGGFAIFSLNYRNSFISDGWIIRTTANGTALWNSTYGGNYFDQFWAGIITSDGDFVCVGMTRSFGAGAGDMWVVRIPDEPDKEDGDGNGPPPPDSVLIIVGVSVAVVVVVVAVYFYRKRS